VEVVTSLSQGRTAAAQCGLFTHKSVPVIFEPPCSITNTYCVYTVLRLLMMDSGPVRNTYSTLSNKFEK